MEERSSRSDILSEAETDRYAVLLL